MAGEAARPSWFQRFLLPGFAFKAVVIGGGYATGRELAEFFVPSGPQGGMLAILLAMALWSVICALTFMFAHATRSFDYRSFFHALLGPFWPLFEIAYVLFAVLLLSVFGAAAGAIGAATFGLPAIAGALLLIAGIAACTAFGSEAVERLFKWATVFLYGVYALFAVFSALSFGDRALATFAEPQPMDGWLLGGATYAAYNVIGAIVILPVARHFTRPRDAAIAGLAAGPLVIWPALVFFFFMMAFYPGIGGETLPSDVLLRELGAPWFHMLFQLMIFSALLESGVGTVHALNERIAAAYKARRGQALSVVARLAIAAAVLGASVFIADAIGLVALIAQGYRALAVALLVLFIAPLFTVGAWRLLRGRTQPLQQAGS